MTNHTDKELLMLAARAAGIDGEYVEGYAPTDYYEDQFYTGESEGVLMTQEGFSHCVWNPIRNDGQSMRLAVKLNFQVNVSNEFNESNVYSEHSYAEESHGKDPCAATRRAIVRAAAAIGGKL